jgi:hypothetical protein
MKLTIAKDELQFGHKQTLNKDFWKDEKLDAEVRLAIIAIVKNFLKTTNLEMTADEIDEIEFTGSLANYNYGKYSDVDIHLLFDFSKIGDDPEFMRDYLTTKAINWNNRHNVTIFGHEVELYITDAGSDHHSTGVYSVKDDKWLVKPVRDTKLSAELNLNKVKDKADKISKEIDMLVSVEGDLSLETIEGLKNKIKKMRVAGLETGGEFSIENLAFKLLRRRGELNTLYALMNQAQDAELSLDEDVEWWKKRRKKDNKNYRELMGHGKKKGVFKKKYAFKNVGKKNKLNRMSGAPYMIDPQMKLPKSGPPGVGSLEEQYSQGTISTLSKVINKLNNGEPVEMKLTDMTLSGFECLGPHSYTLKKSGDSYSIKLKQSVSSILSQQAKTMKDAGDFNPLEKCVYEAGEGVIDDVELKDIILDQLSAGKAEFVFIAPKLPAFKMPDISDVFTTKESRFIKKLRREKDTTKVELTLFAKKEISFTNLPTWGELWKDISEGVAKSGGWDLNAAKYPRIFKDILVKYSNKFDWIIYDLVKKDGYKVIIENKAVKSERGVPVAGTLESLKTKILIGIQEKIDSGDLNAIQGKLLEKAFEIIFRIGLTAAGESNGFTKKEWLYNVNDETEGNFCKYFDCKKSQIRRVLSEKERIAPMSIEKYVRGARGFVEPDVQAQTEKDRIKIFVDKIEPQAGSFFELKGVLNLKDPSQTSGGRDGAFVNKGVGMALLAMNKSGFNIRLVKGEFKGYRGSFQKRNKDALNKAILDTISCSTIRELTGDDAPTGALENYVFSQPSVRANMFYISNSDAEINLTKDCKEEEGGGTQKLVLGNLPKYTQNPFTTGLVIQVSSGTNELLEKVGGKFGFMKAPAEYKNNWWMTPAMAEKWRNFDSKVVNVGDVVVDMNPVAQSTAEIQQILRPAAAFVGVLERSNKVSFKLHSGIRKGDEGSQHQTGNAVDIQFIVNNQVLSYAKTYAYLISFMAEDLIPAVSLGIYQKGKYDPNSFVPSSGNVHIDPRPRRAWFWFDRCSEYGDSAVGKNPRKKLEKCNGVQFNDGAAVVSKNNKKKKDFRNQTFSSGSKSNIIDKNLLRLPSDLISLIREVRTNVQRLKPQKTEEG